MASPPTHSAGLWGQSDYLTRSSASHIPSDHPCSKRKHQVCFIWESEAWTLQSSCVPGSLLPLFLAPVMALLRWALFSGSLAAASSAFHKHVQSCCMIRGINEKGRVMGTCYPVCRPVSSSAAMHIIYPDFLEVEDFSLVMHRELSHHCTTEQGKTMCGNMAKVAVKIQEVPFLSMTPWWFSD